MDLLKQKFYEKSLIHAKDVKFILQEHGDKVVDDVKINQVYGGMRDITSILWETSLLDPIEGISFRGYSIPQLQELLPKGQGTQPLPEGIFWLMLVGEIPTEEEAQWLSNEWERRQHVIPEHVFKAIRALPATAHPMSQFIVGINALQTESTFVRRYAEGMPKSEFWDATYEDSMNLIACLPRIAAYIYRRVYFNSHHIAPFNSHKIYPNPTMDWGGSFAHLLGIKGDEFKDYLRLFLTLHADHEGGNASAHTTHLVGSTLSDPYLAFAGGMNALAGPLHGLANQEALKWILEMRQALNTEKPSKEQIKEYVEKTIASGKVVPGYGHAVLRKPDPRFMAQMGFAQKHLSDSPLVETVWTIFEVVPPILSTIGKIKNPWPNVDAHSGAILTHYGLTQNTFYTVLFGVSRSLGVLAQLCWSRALGFPLERPKSVTTAWIKEFLAKEVTANS